MDAFDWIAGVYMKALGTLAALRELDEDTAQADTPELPEL